MTRHAARQWLRAHGWTCDFPCGVWRHADASGFGLALPSGGGPVDSARLEALAGALTAHSPADEDLRLRTVSEAAAALAEGDE